MSSSDRWIWFDFEVWSWRWLESPFSPGPEISFSWRRSWIVHTIRSQKWDEMNKCQWLCFCFYIWQHTVTSARNTGQGFDPNWRGFAVRNPCHQMRGSAGHCFRWRACHRWLGPAVCSGPSCATCALDAPVIQFRAIQFRCFQQSLKKTDVHGEKSMTILPFHATKKWKLPAMLDQNEAADIQRWKTR